LRGTQSPAEHWLNAHFKQISTRQKRKSPADPLRCKEFQQVPSGDDESRSHKACEDDLNRGNGRVIGERRKRASRERQPSYE
ncbi:MAG: hypothetical protein WB524_19910, partial [Acidobacteriaceae bacterium]